MIATSKDAKDRGSWLTIKEAAGVFGVTPQGFRSSFLQMIKPEYIQPGAKRKPLRVYGPAVVDAYLDRELTKRIDRNDGLVVEGGDSPNLERCRLAKAQLLELELQQKKGVLLPREKVRSGLGRFAAIIRQLGERLGKRHGPEVFGSVNDALDDCQRVIDDEFGRCDDIPDDAA